MSSPLDGLRVLDLTTSVAGGVAGMLLADFGAEVVRATTPAAEANRQDPGFATWDRGKQALLVETSQHARQVVRLVDGADVVITDGRAAADDASEKVLSRELEMIFDGLVDAPALAADPGRVLLRMPPYRDGADPDRTPWGGSESAELLAAISGLSMRQSSWEPGPVDLVFPHVLYVQGIWAATCVVAALIERRRSGSGQTVSVSGMQAALIAGYATYLIDPAQPEVLDAVGPGGPNPCYTRYQGSDGRWLFLGALTPKFQLPAFAALGMADLLDDPRLGGDLNAILSPDNRVWVRQRMQRAFASRDRDDWLRILSEAGVPAGPLGEQSDWLDHPQLDAIGMRVRLQDPRRGPVTMPGIPLVLTATPGRIRGPAPVPEFGQAPDWQPAIFEHPGRSSGAGPLAGTTVLDLGTILAGPFAGTLLAELGADVIKVEPPTGDPFRVNGFTYNRGMRSIAVDLRNDAGREVFYDLVRSADLVIDNYRPGVLQRLKIDYPVLSAINPKVSTISITGYGEGGPMTDHPGFDPILQALSGMMTAQGGDDEPVFLTIAVNDIAGGTLGALAGCLATYHRTANGGNGQRIWTSLAGIAAFMQSGEITRFDGRPAPRRGGRDYQGPCALDRFYPTADGWVRLQAPGLRPQLQRIGMLPEDELDERSTAATLADAFADWKRDDLVEELRTAGIPVAPARTTSELVNCSDLMADQLFEQHSRPSGRPYFLPGRLVGFSRSTRKQRPTAPGLGEHTVELLTEVGYPTEKVRDMMSSGAVIAGGSMELERFVIYR